MTSEKLDEPYTRISNDLIESFYRLPLPSNSFRALMWIVRNSYGWRRKFAPDPGVRPMAKDLGMAPSSALLAIRVLLDWKIISRDSDGRFLIMKKYESWVVAAKKGVQPAEHLEGGGVQPTERVVFSPLSGSVQPTEQSVQPTEHLSSKSEAKTSVSKGLKKRKKGKKTDASFKKNDAAQAYEIKTDLQKVICSYKVLLGFDANDREWDKEQYAKNTRHAKKLLKAFDGSARAAIYWLNDYATNKDERGAQWNLAFAASDAMDGKARRKRDQEINSQRTEKDNGQKLDIPMDQFKNVPRGGRGPSSRQGTGGDGDRK